MRILLIEDDEQLASFIQKGLKEHGFVCEHLANGKQGLLLALKEEYSLIILDLMLPELDGLKITEEVRKTNSVTPILILSAKRSVEEKVKGLRIGGDDYLTKPFAFVELLARVHALLRRSSSKQTESQILRVGDIVLDRISHSVTRAEKKIELTFKEFVLLEYLMKNAEEVVSRTMLMDKVWNCQFDISTNVIDVHICRLREKLNKGFDTKMLETIRGVGYVLKAIQ